MRKIAKTFAALAVLASVAVAPAAPAQAAGTCSLVAPPKVAVTTPYRAISVSLAGDCATAGVSYATWYGYHPTLGLEDVLIFDGAKTAIWDLYDDDPLYRRDWRPDGAWDSAFNDVAQNGASTDIRVGSQATISSSRSGSSVTLKVTATRYAYTVDRFVGWSGSRGQLQYRTSSTGPWVGMKYVYPDSSGHATWSYRISTARDYRVVFPDVQFIWGKISNVTRR